MPHTALLSHMLNCDVIILAATQANLFYIACIARSCSHKALRFRRNRRYRYLDSDARTVSVKYYEWKHNSCDTNIMAIRRLTFITRNSTLNVFLYNQRIFTIDIRFKNTISRHTVNSLGPTDAIWHWRSWSLLVQVMACCLTTPNHYPNQCWLVISKVQWHSSEDTIIRRFEDTNQ